MNAISLPPNNIRVAYLVNHYPAVSHSFIRREIHALERRGFCVQRIALRGWAGPLADPQDVLEREQTTFVLRQGLLSLFATVVATAASHPRRFFIALALTTRLARGSDRPFLFHCMYLAEACTVRRWMKKQGTAHIHAHFGTNSAEVAMLACELGSGRYSFTVHGPDEFDRPAALNLLEKIRRAAFIVAISSYTRSQLMRWSRPADWPKINVVHCGLEPGFYREETPPVGASDKFVCVGRLTEQKGHLLLLDAMRMVFDRGHAFTLVLVGDGELREPIRQRSVELGLEPFVRIAGWLSGAEVRTELLSARALLLPSFAEGLPVAIMEAMALRIPVITTFVAGIPELVVEGETGWLVPAGDQSLLSAAIIECLGASSERLESMGELARIRVLSRHDIDQEAGKLAALIQSHAVAAVPEADGQRAA